MFLKLLNSKYHPTTARWIGFSIYITFLLFLTQNINAQSRKSLEQQRQELINEIRETTKLIEQTKDKQENTLEKIDVLESQIDKRQQLLQNIDDQILDLDQSITNTDSFISINKAEIKKLKDEYANMIVKAYRMKKSNADWLFILSADNIMQSFRRWQYLKQYDRYRKRQLVLIQEHEHYLLDKYKTLANKKKNKEVLQNSIFEQKGVLESEKKQNDDLVLTLNKDEKKLRANLLEKQAQRVSLNKEIEYAIAAEIAARRKKEVKRREALQKLADEKAASKVANSSNNNSEERITKPKPIEPKEEVVVSFESEIDIALSATFESNKGRLPAPSEGELLRKFGDNTHPLYKNIKIKNNGIDIQTALGANVQAVFGGEVIKVKFIPGIDKLIMIKHGNYYTIYSNISETMVREGTQVKTGQLIGTLNTNNEDNKSILHFELWHHQLPINPLTWLRK
jgi:murein hydrolase activator